MVQRIAIARTESDIESVRGLWRRYAESLPFSLDYQGFEEELAGLPRPYAAPHGVLRIAIDGDACLGAVGLRRLAPGIAEIKRLYVVAAARGSGLGRRLLSRVIEDAAAAGYGRVRLDSHRASMRAAIGLYLSLGFVEIAPYGPDLDGEIAFFEKLLPE